MKSNRSNERRRLIPESPSPMIIQRINQTHPDDLCCILQFQPKLRPNNHVRKLRPGMQRRKQRGSERRISGTSLIVIISSCYLYWYFVIVCNHLNRYVIYDNWSITMQYLNTMINPESPCLPPPRIAFMTGDNAPLHPPGAPPRRLIHIYPTEITDMTQHIPDLDSSDEENPDLAFFRHQKIRQSPLNEECEPYAEWQTSSFPTCNLMHELDIPSGAVQSSRSGGVPSNKTYKFRDYTIPELFPRSEGGGRNVWKISTKTPTSSSSKSFDSTTFAMKTLRWKRDFTEKEWDHSRIDALASERLTSSPYITDIYGHCGYSVWNEFAEEGTLDRHLRDRKESVGWKQKLIYAIQIANMFIDLQRIDCGSRSSGSDYEDCYRPALLHNDVGANNILLFKDGQLKLNDFNIGVMMYRNVTSGSTCTFQNENACPKTGQRLDLRSPEECSKKRILDEKVDVFGMGNALYFLLAERRPFDLTEHEKNMTIIQRRSKIIKGAQPDLPEEVKTSKDIAVRVIKEAMKMCRKWDKRERPDVVEIRDKFVKALKKISEQNR